MGPKLARGPQSGHLCCTVLNVYRSARAPLVSAPLLIARRSLLEPAYVPYCTVEYIYQSSRVALRAVKQRSGNGEERLRITNCALRIARGRAGGWAAGRRDAMQRNKHGASARLHIKRGAYAARTTPSSSSPRSLSLVPSSSPPRPIRPARTQRSYPSGPRATLRSPLVPRPLPFSSRSPPLLAAPLSSPLLSSRFESSRAAPRSSPTAAAAAIARSARVLQCPPLDVRRRRLRLPSDDRNRVAACDTCASDVPSVGGRRAALVHVSHRSRAPPPPSTPLLSGHRYPHVLNPSHPYYSQSINMIFNMHTVYCSFTHSHSIDLQCVRRRRPADRIGSDRARAPCFFASPCAGERRGAARRACAPTSWNVMKHVTPFAFASLPQLLLLSASFPSTSSCFSLPFLYCPSLDTPPRLLLRPPPPASSRPPRLASRPGLVVWSRRSAACASALANATRTHVSSTACLTCASDESSARCIRVVVVVVVVGRCARAHAAHRVEWRSGAGRPSGGRDALVDSSRLAGSDNGGRLVSRVH